MVCKHEVAAIELFELWLSPCRNPQLASADAATRRLVDGWIAEQGMLFDGAVAWVLGQCDCKKGEGADAC